MEGEFVSIRVSQGIYPPTLYFRIKLKNRDNCGYSFFAYKVELILENEHKTIATSVNFENFEMFIKDENTTEAKYLTLLRRL